MENTHSYFMARCIEIAQCGMGHVAPNPLVGSVIVKDDKIIGEGFHRAYGGPHAEVNAIASVPPNTDFSQTTLYVNLEPCSHFGKTPPCADLIIQRGFKKVIIGCQDPNPLVSGKGISKLREAGIDVIQDVEREKCEWLNRRFLIWHKENRPYVILKWAESSDGYIDKEREQGEKGIHWISSSHSRRLVHQWRSEESAILIGGQTMITDNPSLTVREVEGKNPLRIVLAGSHSIPLNSPLLSEEATTLFIHSGKQQSRQAGSLNHLYCADEDSIRFTLNELFQRKIQSVLVEGGRRVLQSFIESGLWDEARVIVGSTMFHSGLKAPAINTNPEITALPGGDQLLFYKRK